MFNKIYDFKKFLIKNWIYNICVYIKRFFQNNSKILDFIISLIEISIRDYIRERLKFLSSYFI